MIRAMQTVGVLALIAAGSVVWLSMRGWRQVRAPLTTMSVVEAFEANAGRNPDAGEGTACGLVAQAEAFGLFLNPPAPAKKPAPPVQKERPPAHTPLPEIRPAAATLKFKLIGTSYSETRPERSMALVVQSGSDETRWVREGEHLGHFVIHEIRPGMVVYLTGEEFSEMALDPEIESTAVAEAGGLMRLQKPQVTAGEVATPRPAGSSRYPRATGARTVGSARSAALN